MARSIKAIYDSLVQEKEQFNSLKALTPNYDKSQDLLENIQSSSKVAEWRLWLWVVAFSQYVLELIFDDFKKEVEEIVSAGTSQNLQWYRARALEFQYGHALELDTKEEKFIYLNKDPNSLIVKNAATDEDSDNISIIMKVAKDGEPLSAVEMDAFKAYMFKIKDAGMRVVYVSSEADRFKIELDVIYDPTVLQADGSLILNPNVKPVELAINDYLTKLPFNGALIINKLVDELQQAEGVIDPDLNEVSAASDQGVYSVVGRSYTPESGYFKFDLDNSVINYIASND
ncbi:MAG: hypothetical protein EP346_00045 [Bacteroidetes bacterium]|nr:MAG: hypothetical protein EP346_00045 [Bacteroidota bacterium]